ncbi:hypothetical protein ASD52_33975 [Ensifer sp. Root142]|uniref:hypothetical protein n=1 Tax=Ensifer TaxID=106591 RepID=UPI00070CF85D|nr:hypothetical protein [Ensifer sp. Root142]KQY68041.1 hypothetical protein ASD52_33975 [Ensifer sp. Root142]
MVFAKAIARGALALSLVVAPAVGGMVGAAGTALAKEGHGNSGGGGGGGNGNGNGGNHGGGSGSSHGKSGTARASKDTRSSKASASDKPTWKSLFTRGKKGPDTAKKAAKADKLTKVEPIEAGVGTPGLRSLNRNYHAYLNSNDPRMAAVSAYAIAYAEFEAENGVDAIPSDPALSDEALRDALAGFSKDGVVTDDMLDEAKDILGVGPDVGKIDQIRETLPPAPVN